jgi:hypothetical protein
MKNDKIKKYSRIFLGVYTFIVIILSIMIFIIFTYGWYSESIGDYGARAFASNMLDFLLPIWMWSSIPYIIIFGIVLLYWLFKFTILDVVKT